MRENNRDRTKRNYYCNLNALVLPSPPNRLVPLFHFILELGFLERTSLYPSSLLLLQFDLLATCLTSISIIVPETPITGTQVCELWQP